MVQYEQVQPKIIEIRGQKIIIDSMELVENFHRFQLLKHSTVMPKAFTEKGLYILATILKSQRAIETTIDNL